MTGLSPMTTDAGPYEWYDSYWLEKFGKAKAWLSVHRPHELEGFIRSFDVLKTDPGFKTTFFADFFDEKRLAEVRSVIASIKPGELELHEAKTFRRFIVHDLPYFTELQRRLLPIVSDAAGEALEVSYNFLSLYGNKGVCPMHMDSPEAKWTLDICIDQSAPWPIHFSKVQDWPDPGSAKPSPSDMAFDSFSLLPGQAILFSGSSQWHYRDTMPDSGGKNYCQLIFFHYVPAGTAQLAKPENWKKSFGLDDRYASK